jgi:hypothetical protein
MRDAEERQICYWLYGYDDECSEAVGVDDTFIATAEKSAEWNDDKMHVIYTGFDLRFE